MRRVVALIGGAAILLGSTAARAEEDDEALVCDEPHEVDAHQLLRRLSLDLRDKIPSDEEYAALEGEASVPPATVQEFIESDDFAAAMRRYHELMFWPNVSNVRLSNQNATLGIKNEGPALRIQSTTKGKTFRGGDGNGNCGDFQHTQFDPAFPGQFRPKPGVAEGWRMVAPYWDPATPVKVCAFDAQETASDEGVACNTPEAINKKGCGCGPDLRFCYGPSSVTSKLILSSLREQLGRAVDDVAAGAPYTDMLLSTKAWQNGAIAFWKKHLADNLSFNVTYNAPDPDEEIASKAFTDETWTLVDRKGLHAGVLTSPGYLLRFQTARGRANRFRITFMCEYFVPPAELEPAAGCDDATTDLTQRCNCQYCHSKLEPMAAFFGQFAEAGTTLMTDFSTFPRMNEDCKGKTSQFCRRFYVTDADAHNAGSLIAYQYADVHADIEKNLEDGPRAMAQSIIDDGTFAHCTVRKVFTHLVKRDIRAQGAESEELALLETLASGFEQSSYSLPWLVREIVSLPQYRRVR
jgi:hypothetical protein